MPAEHEESLGTVIRHPVDHATESDSEADMSEMPEIEEDELESELQALKEDFEEPSQFIDIRNQTRNASGHPTTCYLDSQATNFQGLSRSCLISFQQAVSRR